MSGGYNNPDTNQTPKTIRQEDNNTGIENPPSNAQQDQPKNPPQEVPNQDQTPKNKPEKAKA